MLPTLTGSTKNHHLHRKETLGPDGHQAQLWLAVIADSQRLTVHVSRAHLTSSFPGAQTTLICAAKPTLPKQASSPSVESCHPSRVRPTVKGMEAVTSPLCPQRPQLHGAPICLGNSPQAPPGCRPPGVRRPFLASRKISFARAYLAEPSTPQQPLGHRKLLRTCQAECHCVSIPTPHWASLMKGLKTGSKKRQWAAGYRLKDTAFP